MFTAPSAHPQDVWNGGRGRPVLDAASRQEVPASGDAAAAAVAPNDEFLARGGGVELACLGCLVYVL